MEKEELTKRGALSFCALSRCDFLREEDKKVNLIQKVLILLVKFYRLFISPHFLPACRFVPTCSEYALLSIKKHGALKGGFLALKRLLKCHPFSTGGYDGVP